MATLQVKAIATFPWVTCNEPIEVGPVRILPYERGHVPGDSPHAQQADIDAMLAAYADRPNQVVTRASLLEVGDWYTGMDAGVHFTKLVQARDAVAFAALSGRRLFAGHFGYCNSHLYTLVVQRYEPGKADRFAFYTRRRDGNVSHIWATRQFAHQRPSHAPANARCDLDKPLPAGLLKLQEKSPLREAILEFNSANTDSDDVPEHVELVMVKSAFEWLLGIKTDVQDFVDALDTLLSPILADPPRKGPMAESWRKLRKKAKRPLEAWARDFCDVRNSAAHGSHKVKPRFAWQVRSHLAFASIFFPLVVKKRLADDGLMTLDETDRKRLTDIEKLLMVDPFSPKAIALVERRAHPWVAFENEVLASSLADNLYRSSRPVTLQTEPKLDD